MLVRIIILSFIVIFIKKIFLLFFLTSRFIHLCFVAIHIYTIFTHFYLTVLLTWLFPLYCLSIIKIHSFFSLSIRSFSFSGHFISPSFLTYNFHFFFKSLFHLLAILFHFYFITIFIYLFFNSCFIISFFSLQFLRFFLSLIYFYSFCFVILVLPFHPLYFVIISMLFPFFNPHFLITRLYFIITLPPLHRLSLAIIYVTDFSFTHFLDAGRLFKHRSVNPSQSLTSTIFTALSSRASPDIAHPSTLMCSLVLPALPSYWLCSSSGLTLRKLSRK